jgi:hypothetical protein
VKTPANVTSNEVLATPRGDGAAIVALREHPMTNEVAYQTWVQTELVKEEEENQLLAEEGGHILKRKLLRQLLAAHETALAFLRRAGCEDNTVEATRLANAGSRLMSAFQQGVLALNTLQGNDQRVTLQQVNVSGGNTVVAGNLRTGPSRPAEEN